jgi:hypothetical protein
MNVAAAFEPTSATDIIASDRTYSIASHLMKKGLAA